MNADYPNQDRDEENPNSDVSNAKRAEGTDKAPDAGSGAPDTSKPGDTPPQGSSPAESTETKAPAMADATSPVTHGTVSQDGRDAPSEEQPNNALTTIDDVAVIKGQAENAQSQDQKDAETATQTPTKVLQDVYDPAPVVQSQDQKDPEAQPLVVSPALGVGLAEANARSAEPAPGINATVLPDIGANVADSTNRTVVVSPEAKPKPTGDGTNAGAIDATGYVAPIRVSAAGVPSTDPTVLAQTAGDGNTTAATASAGPGTSDKPDASLPSQGVDATTLSTNARIGGNAQSQNPAGQASTLTENEAARVGASVAAITGAPLPASSGDRTLATPVPAGDLAAAERVGAVVPPDAGKADPSARATAVEAANNASRPGDIPADPNTARPLDGTSPTPVAWGGQPHASISGEGGTASAPEPEKTPEERQADAVETLSSAGILPAAIVADVRAKTEGPQSVEDLDKSLGTAYDVTHNVVIETTYLVHAASAEDAIQAVKDGKGVSTHTSSDDDWSADRE